MAFQKDFNQETEKVQSRINAAGLINSTLERLWVESYTAMSNGQYYLWNTKLDAIWAILGGDTKDNDKDDKEITRINLKIYEMGSLKSTEGIGFEKKSNTNNAIQYQWLLKKSLFLRRLQNKQGKGTAYTSDEYDDFD